MFKHFLRFRSFCVLASALFLAASCQENRMDRFEREAKEFTEKKCPQSFDNGIVLDSMVFHKGPENVMQYCYTVSGPFDDENIFSKLMEEIKPKMLSGVKSAVDLKELKSSGVTISYRYMSSKTGKELYKINFTKDDYRMRHGL